MELLKAILNLPNDNEMNMWQKSDGILPDETRSANANRAMNQFYQLMNNEKFVSVYRCLTPDQQSLLPLMMIAREDLNFITPVMVQDNSIESDYELEIAS